MRALGVAALCFVLLAFGCIACTNARPAYHVNAVETPTAEPTPAQPLPGARSVLLRAPARVALPRPDLSFSAELDRTAYRSGSPVGIRFRLTDRRNESVAFGDEGPRNIAELTLRDPDGSIERPDDSLMSPPRPIFHPSLMSLRSGTTFVTVWYPLTEWGYRPLRKGSYVLGVVPSIGAASALLIDYRAERALRFAHRNTLQFSIR